MKLASFYVDFKARKGVDVAELKTFVDNYIDNYKLAIIPSSYESNSIRVYGDANALDEILMTIPFDKVSDVRSHSCGVIEIPLQKLMDKHFRDRPKGGGYQDYVDVVFQVLCHAAKVFFGKNFQRVVKHLRVLLQEFCTSLFEQIEIFVCVYVMEI